MNHNQTELNKDNRTYKTAGTELGQQVVWS
jgi:hypothetical protein